jgi:hypothetical protein
MSQDNNPKAVYLFTMPQQFPCGPGSACCGPIGQTEEEIQKLKESLEKELGVSVEVKNVIKGEDMRAFRSILGIFRTFGPMSLPIISIGEEIVSMGNPTPEEAVAVVRETLTEKGIL